MVTYIVNLDNVIMGIRMRRSSVRNAAKGSGNEEMMIHMKNKNGMTTLARFLAISAVAALILVGTATGEVSREGLVGEWHFEGDAKDSSGNNGIFIWIKTKI